MEHVPGQPLSTYCDQRGLGLEERLTLFVKVCGPVQYAHQRLVVHRDLKPSNILVTDDGAVKLLDFGIAKLLDAEASVTGAQPPATRTGLLLLTPEYAAPEQFRGDEVTTA
ncbi:MAG: protein kinase, partial [Acidobacteria bacterium]|nr:protein kinase [Acidobacteriota bacterium]